MEKVRDAILIIDIDYMEGSDLVPFNGKKIKVQFVKIGLYGDRMYRLIDGKSSHFYDYIYEDELIFETNASKFIEEL